MNLFKLILNPQVYSARLGAQIAPDTTVSELLAPPSDHDAWQSMGCLDDFTHTKETIQDDDFVCYDPQGNPIQDSDEIVVSDGFTWRSNRTNDFVTELAYGLTGPPVNGQPMEAFAKTVREINVWLKIQGQNAYDRTQFLTLNVYGKITLPNPIAYKNTKSVRPELMFKKRGPAPAIVRFGPELNL